MDVACGKVLFSLPVEKAYIRTFKETSHPILTCFLLRRKYSLCLDIKFHDVTFAFWLMAFMYDLAVFCQSLKPY